MPYSFRSTGVAELVTVHPRWAGRSVTLICGPPGSGKSTLAAELHPKVLELVYDDGDVRQRLKLFGRKAWRIGRASAPDVAVVRGAASVVEREHHENLCHPARTIVLLTPPEVCHVRVESRGRDTVGSEHAEIDRWWRVWRAENPPPEARSGRWL